MTATSQEDELRKQFHDVLAGMFVSIDGKEPESSKSWYEYYERKFLDLTHQAIKQAFERGRIAEAKTCEQSKRHDYSRAIKRAELEGRIAEMKLIQGGDEDWQRYSEIRITEIEAELKTLGGENQ